MAAITDQSLGLEPESAVQGGANHRKSPEPTIIFDGREWKLHSLYHRSRRGWVGIVFWNPDWVAMHCDSINSRLVCRRYAFTERGIRRRLDASLHRERHRHHLPSESGEATQREPSSVPTT